MPNKRSMDLDFLRGVAILLVLGRHLPDFPEGSDFFLWPFRIWQRVGWIGVDLFFVLSGFLVSGLLFAEWKTHGNIRLGRFFIRRGFKIYPAYYMMLFLSAALIFHNVPKAKLLSMALFIQSYVSDDLRPWSHSWSLAVEEHFYLLLGLFLFVLSRRRCREPFRWIVPAFIAIAVLSLALRLLGFMQGYLMIRIFFRSHYRMDGLFSGVLISYLYNFHYEKFRVWAVKYRRWLLLCVPSLLIPVFAAEVADDFFMNTFFLTYTYIAFGALLITVLFKRQSSQDRPLHPARRIIAFIGFYSYSIYLWHVPFRKVVLVVLHQHMGIQPGFYVETIFYVTTGICAGILMATLIELPFLKWRDRLFPSRSRSSLW